MPSSRKPKARLVAKKNLSGSALDGEQRQLDEQKRKVQAQIAALERTISEAPQHAPAAVARRLRPLAPDASGTHGLPRSPHYKLNSFAATADDVVGFPGAPAGKRSGGRAPKKPPVLRKEREEGRLQTVALLVALVILIGWVLCRFL